MYHRLYFGASLFSSVRRNNAAGSDGGVKSFYKTSLRAAVKIGYPFYPCLFPILYLWCNKKRFFLIRYRNFNILYLMNSVS